MKICVRHGDKHGVNSYFSQGWKSEQSALQHDKKRTIFRLSRLSWEATFFVGLCVSLVLLTLERNTRLLLVD